MLPGISNMRDINLFEKYNYIFVSLIKNQSLLSINGGKRKNPLIDELLIGFLSLTKLKHVLIILFSSLHVTY